jgi:hypothetical protein
MIFAVRTGAEQPGHEKALPPEMLSSQVPQGVRRFCPRFYRMGGTDKRAFWAYSFQALAGTEAGLNPNTSVRHTEHLVGIDLDRLLRRETMNFFCS